MVPLLYLFALPQLHQLVINIICGLRSRHEVKLQQFLEDTLYAARRAQVVPFDESSWGELLGNAVLGYGIKQFV